MNTIRILASVALFAVTSAAQQAVTLPETLEGNGHSCKGRFSRTGKSLYWKAVFDSCRSPYTVIAHDGTTWLLQVKYSKTCGYNFIEIDPSSEQPGTWIVQGFTDPKYPLGNLACAMYPVTAKQINSK